LTKENPEFGVSWPIKKNLGEYSSEYFKQIKFLLEKIKLLLDLPKNNLKKWFGSLNSPSNTILSQSYVDCFCGGVAHVHCACE